MHNHNHYGDPSEVLHKHKLKNLLLSKRLKFLQYLKQSITCENPSWNEEISSLIQLNPDRDVNAFLLNRILGQCPRSSNLC